VEFEVLVGWILRALESNHLVIPPIRAGTDPVSTKGKGRMRLPDLDAVRIAATSRPNRPVLHRTRNDRYTGVRDTFPAKELVSAVNASDGVISSVDVEFYLPLLAVVISERSQDDFMDIVSGVEAGQEKTVARILEVVVMVIGELRIIGHCGVE